VSRGRLRVALLAVSAGCVDAVGFLLLFGLFTAHLSGDTTHLAVDLGSGDFGHDALARLAVLVVFVAGIVVGVAIMAANAKRRRGLLAVEIALLMALMVTGAVAIEKPFGTDLASARHLNEIIRLRLPEPTIFRIDHFLSNDLVRRVLTLRFLNRIFEPIWNSTHIESIDISWLESLTLEGRAGYYDTAGAMKDMIQNHLMEALALVLMEQPARVDAHSFRDVRVEALRAVATPTPARMRDDTIRARYTEGTIGTRHVPSYVDEPGVDPSRNTETYASLTLHVNSPRWAGVPFTLRSGKALADDAAEIAVQFRPVPGYLLDQWPGVEPNVLRVGLTDPYVALATTLNGPDRSAETRHLDARSTAPTFTAYGNLILHMLQGDPMLFIRGDEAEESWRIADPVMAAWAAGEVPMREYPAGQPPPAPGT